MRHRPKKPLQLAICFLILINLNNCRNFDTPIDMAFSHIEKNRENFEVHFSMERDEYRRMDNTGDQIYITFYKCSDEKSKMYFDANVSNNSNLRNDVFIEVKKVSIGDIYCSYIETSGYGFRFYRSNIVKYEYVPENSA
jgi:hypothetical protein